MKLVREISENLPDSLPNRAVTRMLSSDDSLGFFFRSTPIEPEVAEYILGNCHEFVDYLIQFAGIYYLSVSESTFQKITFLLSSRDKSSISAHGIGSMFVECSRQYPWLAQKYINFYSEYLSLINIVRLLDFAVIPESIDPLRDHKELELSSRSLAFLILAQVQQELPARSQVLHANHAIYDKIKILVDSL